VTILGRMRLDPLTLALLLCLQLVALALSLSVITGWQRSAAMRWGLLGVWAQVGAWFSVLSIPWAGLAGLAASYALSVTSFVCVLQGLQGWLGPRPLMRPAWALPLLAPLLVLLGPDASWARRGVPDLLVSLSLVLLATGLLWPSAGEWQRQRWRWVLALPIALLVLLTLWRAVLGFGPAAQYPVLRSGHPLALAILVLGNLSTVLGALALLAGWRGEAEAALREAARSDPLTGLANRRELEHRGLEMIQLARRHGDTLLALMIDLDHFKQVNDHHGHAQGDAALQLMAALLQQGARSGDCLARIGGEEFVVLLARSEVQGAQAFDQRLRTLQREQAPGALGFALDHSAGWTALRAEDRDVHDLLKRADAALYRAKSDGRGCLRGEP
jgi:diguanylate cyclase (GGDEF)-like protein